MNNYNTFKFKMLVLIYHIVYAEDVMGEVKKAKALSAIVRDNIGKIFVSTIAPVGVDEIGKLAYANQLAQISGGFVWANGELVGFDEVEEDVNFVRFEATEFASVATLSNNTTFVVPTTNHIKKVVPITQKSFSIISAAGLTSINLDYSINLYHIAYSHAKNNNAYNIPNQQGKFK